MEYVTVERGTAPSCVTEEPLYYEGPAPNNERQAPLHMKGLPPYLTETAPLLLLLNDMYTISSLLAFLFRFQISFQLLSKSPLD
jgi:hypothetical protein